MLQLVVIIPVALTTLELYATWRNQEVDLPQHKPRTPIED